MKNNQSGFLKILLPVVLLIFISHTSYSQVSSYRLKTADSLFNAKLYFQSLEHYQEILKQNQYTPSMLLKMAFIEEGLEHIGKAMYYLNLYYLATQDETALEKIGELAQKYGLEGYEITQASRALSFYHKNHIFISGAIAAVMIFFASLAFYTRTKLKRKPFVLFTFLALTAAVFVGHLFYGEQLTPAIVSNPETYIMNGPSAGASVIDIIKDGHRVEIVGRNDVWLRVRWNGEVAYIRENSLLPVEL